MRKVTRRTAALALAVQWVGQALTFHMGTILINALVSAVDGYDVWLPPHTRLAINLLRPGIWLTLGGISSAVIIAVECFVKSERRRLVVQIVNVALWSMIDLGSIWAILSVVNALS